MEMVKFVISRIFQLLRRFIAVFHIDGYGENVPISIGKDKKNQFCSLY
jgi:hypothetical protein